MNGEIVLAWRGGEDKFCISSIHNVLALEEACQAGVFEIAERLEGVTLAAAAERLGGRARINDVRETIRLGLIGGGKSPLDAMKLIRLHVDGQPTLESVLLAYHILAAMLRGVPGDEVGKGEAERAKEGESGSTMKAPDASSVPLATA